MFVIEEQVAGDWIEIGRYSSKRLADEALADIEATYPSPTEPDADGAYPPPRYRIQCVARSGNSVGG